jgi:hypothetical protein
MTTRHTHVSPVVLALATIILAACNSGTKESNPAAPSAPQSSEKVYVIFEGPWAIVPDPKDTNSVLALAPKTKSHRDLVIETSDKVLSAGIYDLSVPTRTGTAAGTVDPSILQTKIDAKNVQHALDDKLERYAIRLPKPDAYVARTHFRSRAGSVYPPEASTEKDYVTTVSLRYSVASLNGFSLAGSPDSGTFNPLLLQVETPVLNFVIHPAYDPDPTDRCNIHSRESFRDLTKLLNVTLFVDFPNDPSECHGKDPQSAQPSKAEGTSNFPSFFARESGGGPGQHLLASIYFFAAMGGGCRAPIIVGGS